MDGQPTTSYGVGGESPYFVESDALEALSLHAFQASTSAQTGGESEDVGLPGGPALSTKGSKKLRKWRKMLERCPTHTQWKAYISAPKNKRKFTRRVRKGIPDELQICFLPSPASTCPCPTSPTRSTNKLDCPDQFH